MFSKLITVVTLCVGATAQLLFQPGVNSGIAVSVIQQGKDAYFNSVMQKINGLQIPDLYSSDGKSWMIGNTFTYLSTAGNVVFSTDVTNNAMVLTCTKVTAMFSSTDFRYHYAPLLNAEGNLEVDLNTIQFTIGAGFGLQTLPDGRTVPLITGQDTYVKINRFDLKIHIGGSFTADLIDLVTPFIKGTLCDVLEQQLYIALNQSIPNALSAEIRKTDGFLHLAPLFSNTFWIDWETPASALVTANSFTIEVKGDMFDTAYGEIDPLVAIPTMPTFDATKPEGYQNYISTWTMDTFGAALTEETPLGAWVNKSYNTTITTGQLNPFLPGIQSFYGDVPCAIHFSITKLGSFNVLEANPQINALATITLEFWALTSTGPQLATSMTLIDTFFGFTITVNNMTMNLQLATTNVDKITVNSCSFGKLSTLLLKTELNNFFRVFTPIINSDLAADTFTVPSNVFGVFQLTNLTLGYYQNYLYVGMTPVFIAPVSAVEQQLAALQ
jgi:hypothetical protein